MRKCFWVQFFYCTLSSWLHVQNVQVSYIGKHLLWWFAAPTNPSSTLGISPNAIPPLALFFYMSLFCDTGSHSVARLECSAASTSWAQSVLLPQPTE